jgi:hypothetical protein
MPYRENSNWGQHLWAFIHTITIIDFEDNQRFTTEIIENLKGISKVIPCKHCVELYETHLKLLDNIDTTQSMILFEWSVDLHNEVNIKVGKPIITYRKALELWCRTI